MVQVTHTLECDAPIDYAFDYVTDYRLIPSWVMGVKRFTPISEQTKDVGAKFDGVLNLGPMPLNLLLSYTEWQDNKEFSANITKGVEGTLTMRFEAISESQTKITAIVDYSVGDGVVAKLLEKAIQAFVPSCLRHVDKQLSRQLNDGYADITTA